MKVVLFCGGQGLRLRDFSEKIPKPMVKIGYRPILWYVMKYYAYYGHKDFILLLGYRGDLIKSYFVNYHEYISNDFVYKESGKNLHLLNTDIHDWTITFLDTGMNTNIGQRLFMAKEHLKNEEMFLANYVDGLTDLPLNKMINTFEKTDFVASFMAYQPQYSFHVVSFNGGEEVKKIKPVHDSDLWINAGYFIFRNSFFDYLKKGEELIIEPFERLIKAHKLMAYKYKGFWKSMDTFKDKQEIEKISLSGNIPWEVWKNHNH